jgi:flagellar basal body-associated protein FliL
MTAAAALLLLGALLVSMLADRGQGSFLAGLRGRGRSLGNGLSFASALSGDAQPPSSMRNEFVVPVGRFEDERRVRMSVVIELEDDEAREALTSRAGQLRDAFISRVVDSGPLQFYGEAGLTRSKRLLREAVHDTDPSLSVRAIYFSMLLVE